MNAAAQFNASPFARTVLHFCDSDTVTFSATGGVTATVTNAPLPGFEGQLFSDEFLPDPAAFAQDAPLTLHLLERS